MLQGWTEWERKVLDTFLDDGRMTRIPAKRSKRDVLLRWLRLAFEPGRTYPESEVNRILRQVHPDCATLRRELFEAGYLAREGGGGAYWRTDRAAGQDGTDEDSFSDAGERKKDPR